MTTLMDVGLLAAQGAVRPVAPLFDVGREPVGAVVAGEQDQRAVGKAETIEIGQQPADAGVDLGHEVAVDAGAAGSLELGRSVVQQ